MLQRGDRVGLVACSDGLTDRDRLQYAATLAALEDAGLVPVESPHLFVPALGLDASGHLRPDHAHPAPDAVRAAELAALFADPSIAAIFDVSGGDLANGVLSHLDLDVVAAHPTPFFGYSDLTTIVNALHARTGGVAHLWSVRTLARSDAAAQRVRFASTLLGGGDDLFRLRLDAVRGDVGDGPAIGGNLRCLLKLAGTPHVPPVDGRVLVLESSGAGPAAVFSGLHQLRQLGVLDAIAGVVLGEFTALQRDCGPDAAVRVLLDVLAGCPGPARDLAIATTPDVGHGPGARALRVGAPLLRAGAGA